MLSSKLLKVEDGHSFTVQRLSPWQSLFLIEKRLAQELLNQNNHLVVTYNPLEYAQEVHCAYLERYMNSPKQVLFIGLNPGPFGMCQTGVNNILLYWEQQNSPTGC